jgi:hypothetical protein
LEFKEGRVAQFGDNLTVKILRDVEKFLMASNTPPTRFGREAMGDPRFVFDLRRGREPGERTVKRVRDYLESAR